MIDKSFVEAVAAIVSKSETPKAISIHDALSIISANGVSKEFAIPPARRNHQAESLETIFNFTGKYPDSSVWYCAENVIVLTDDADRRDRMTMPLLYSTQLLTLMAWEGKGQQGQVMTQREAILLLRTVFKGCLRQHETLIANMRLMKSSVGGGGSSQVEQGKRSIDKRLEHQWTGADAIPECVTFNVPIFESRFSFDANVEVAIDSNPEKETFTFIPIPGSITAAIEAAESKIGEHLHTLLMEHPRIYYGSPTT